MNHNGDYTKTEEDDYVIESLEEAAVVPEHLQDQDLDHTFTEYGLVTPDGTVHWGVYSGNPLTTPEERFIMMIRLQRTGEELGFPGDEFVSRYGWLGRSVHQVVHRSFADAGSFPIDSEVVSTPPPQPQE